MIIRTMTQRDLNGVSAVCLRSFKQCVADSLPPKGAKTFSNVVSPKALSERLQKDNLMFVAEDGGQPVGMIELKEGRHIAMFFIEPSYQRQGIGRQLLREAFEHVRRETITVNASLSSVPAYERFGFELNGEVGESGGLIYQPMALEIG